MLVVFMISCDQQPPTDLNYFKQLTIRKTGIDLTDPIELLTSKDVGIDLHGTLAENYTIGISTSDMRYAMDQITKDSVNEWKESDLSYMLTIYPNSIEDTLFAFSLLKAEPRLQIQLFK